MLAVGLGHGVLALVNQQHVFHACTSLSGPRYLPALNEIFIRTGGELPDICPQAHT